MDSEIFNGAKASEGSGSGYGTAELHRALPRSPALLGVFVVLFGLILAGGGAYLAALGGSWYYALVGVMFVVAGYLMIKRKITGLYTYIGAFAFTSVWTFWEVGLSGWQLIPRLVAPFVLLVLAILVAPALDQTTGRRARKLTVSRAAIRWSCSMKTCSLIASCRNSSWMPG
jgi:quinoprotein glucose dehydrogenase